MIKKNDKLAEKEDNKVKDKNNLVMREQRERANKWKHKKKTNTHITNRQTDRAKDRHNVMIKQTSLKRKLKHKLKLTQKKTVK